MDKPPTKSSNKPGFLQRRVYSSGITEINDPAKAEKMYLLNQLLFWGVLAYIPNLVYEISLNLPWTSALDGIFIILMLISFFINRVGHYDWARNIILISVNVILVLASYSEGILAGNYLLYLPLIVLFSLLVRINEEKKIVIFLFLINVLCISLSFLICPQESTLQNMTPVIYKTMFKANLGTAFILTAGFTYLVALVNFDKEKQMIKAKLKAEEISTAKSEFLSNMSHELRTPLNGIIGTSNLLLQEDYLQAQKEHLDILKYSSEHILLLINDILDFSKIEAGKLELEKKQVNLHSLLFQVQALFARQFREKGLKFKVEKDSQLDIYVIADETRLNQVLNNLLSNALKFTNKGEVVLSAIVESFTDDSISVRFGVKDTGIGIPEDKLSRVFESFTQADAKTTRKYGGTGLGLSISKKIIEAFNGELSIHSKHGGGSEFYFTIHFLKAPFQEKYADENVKKNFKSLKGLKLLIAEDNKINMLVARKFLEAWDVSITEAENGIEAVKICRNEKFDLLLLDLEMPEMDGYTALKEIRTIYNAIPAIAFTAAMFTEIDTHLQHEGFNDFLRKPFRPEDLYNKIKQYKKLP
jgi:signal transduction histidine kinase/FixJ family two-component response regulator